MNNNNNPWVPKHIKTNFKIPATKIKDINEKDKKKKEFYFKENLFSILTEINKKNEEKNIKNNNNYIINSQKLIENKPIKKIQIDQKLLSSITTQKTGRNIKNQFKGINQQEKIESYKSTISNIPKLIIPSSNTFNENEKNIKRPNTTRITIKKLDYNSPHLELPTFNNLQILRNSISKTPTINDRDLSYKMENSSLPLYLFDDISYDKKIIETIRSILPTNGYCFYSFDGISLQWRECEVISYDSKTFLYGIKWDKESKPKYVYRISLRFLFDDLNLFLKRREKALKLREEVEKEIKLYTYLNGLVLSNLHQIPSNMMKNILFKIPNNFKNYYNFKELTSEVISEFEFGEKLAHYIDCWKDPLKIQTFIQKGLIEYKLKPHNFITCGSISNININIPIPIPLYRINSILLELKELKLFKNFKDFNYIIDYKKFFDENSSYLNLFFSNLLSETFPKILDNVKLLLYNWPNGFSNNLFKMIDLRIISILEIIVKNSLYEFLNELKNNKIFFII